MARGRRAPIRIVLPAPPALKADLEPQPNGHRVAPIAARVDDVLHVGLEFHVLGKLDLVEPLDRRLVGALVHVLHSRAQARVGDAEPDGVLIPAGNQALVDHPAPVVLGDLVPVVRRPAKLPKDREALLVALLRFLAEERLVYPGIHAVVVREQPRLRTIRRVLRHRHDLLPVVRRVAPEPRRVLPLQSPLLPPRGLQGRLDHRKVAAFPVERAVEPPLPAVGVPVVQTPADPEPLHRLRKNRHAKGLVRIGRHRRGGVGAERCVDEVTRKVHRQEVHVGILLPNLDAQLVVEQPVLIPVLAHLGGRVGIEVVEPHQVPHMVLRDPMPRHLHAIDEERAALPELHLLGVKGHRHVQRAQVLRGMPGVPPAAQIREDVPRINHLRRDPPLFQPRPQAPPVPRGVPPLPHRLGEIVNRAGLLLHGGRAARPGQLHILPRRVRLVIRRSVRVLTPNRRRGCQPEDRRTQGRRRRDSGHCEDRNEILTHATISSKSNTSGVHVLLSPRPPAQANKKTPGALPYAWETISRNRAA